MGYKGVNRALFILRLQMSCSQYAGFSLVFVVLFCLSRQFMLGKIRREEKRNGKEAVPKKNV